MPRKPRNNLTSKFYHIMTQGINREYIFNDDDSIIYYRELMHLKREKLNINILAYCIMNNHVHILVNTDAVSDMSKYMQKINSSYSNYYNKINRRVGYVFRDRYLSEEILNERQLFNCIKYIHFNPVKAKMVLKPQNYKYSSYNEFLGKKYLITEQSISLLFGKCNNYKKEFQELHKTRIDEEENFVDIKDIEIQEFIKKLEKININIKDIKNDKKLTKRIIKMARTETNVTVRELADILGISKSKVSKLDNN